MRIIELFKSIQGEGLYIGIPSIFVRFKDCNLHCSWCDTKYSWAEPGCYTWRDAVKFIRDAPVYNHIVFTGGEPLLPENQDEMLSILQHTMTSNSKITIETNGLIKPDNEIRDIMKNKGLWSVSPKLQFMKDYNPATLRFFDDQKSIQWKFVITEVEKNVNAVIDLMERGIVTANINVPIVLQPNGYVANYHTACRELVEYVINNNFTEFRVLPQFHKICWGNQRGI